MVPEEHPAAGALGSASLDVPGQRFPDVARKRETVLTATLSAHEDLTEAPIDIVEFEPDDFSAAQSEADEEHQDGVIAASQRTATVAAPQQTGHLARLDRPRQVRGPPRHRQHGLVKHPIRQTLHLQPAKERTQCRDCLTG